MRAFSLFTAGLVAAATVAAPAAAGRDDHKNKLDPKDSETVECTDELGRTDTVTFNGDQMLWPPNHKYAPYSVIAEAADDGENVRLLTWIEHDEYLTALFPDGDPAVEDQEEPAEPGEENGAGNTQSDADPLLAYQEGTGSAQTDHRIRSERSGRGDGRVYTVEVRARFGGAAGVGERECNASFTVEVPHDMRSDNAPAPKDRTGDDEGTES